MNILRVEDENQVSSTTWVIRSDMPAMGITIGRRASVIFEGFMRVVFLRVSVDVGVPDDGFGRSSTLSVDGGKVGGGAADAARKTLLSKGEYNIDMYTRRGYISLRPLSLSLANPTSLGAAS